MRVMPLRARIFCQFAPIPNRPPSPSPLPFDCVLLFYPPPPPELLQPMCGVCLYSDRCWVGGDWRLVWSGRIQMLVGANEKYRSGFTTIVVSILSILAGLLFASSAHAALINYPPASCAGGVTGMFLVSSSLTV